MLSGGNALEILKLYREVQILNNVCNIVQQQMLGSIILASTMALSGGLGVLLQIFEKMNSDTNIMIAVAMVISFADGFVTHAVLLGGMVSVCGNSKKLLQQAKCVRGTNGTRKDIKLTERLWQCSDKIRIKFSDSNFLEELTPLRCLDYAVAMTIQFLLLSRNKSSGF